MSKKLTYLFSFVLVLVAVPIVTNAQVENLVQNPSFEEDEAILDDPDWQAWVTWGWEGGLNSTVGIDETEFIDGARSLRIEPQGGTDWYFILLQDYIPLEVGTQYTVSFWAKAESPRSLPVQLKATDNSVSWGWTDFQLATEWAEYTFNSEAENAEAKLEFLCATVEVPFWLDLVSVYAEAGEPASIVINGDFELPDEGKINTDWDLIPGWSSDTPPADSGLDIEETYPGYGYTAFLMDGDPSVWQTTSHIIAPGNQFTLSLVASDYYTDLVGNWGVLGGGQLTVSLYYEDGGMRTPVATTDIMPASSYTEMYGPFELAFNAADVPASIGYAIGIEIVNSSPTAVPNHSWVFFDNVQLAVTPPLMTNGSFEEDEVIQNDEDYEHWWTWGMGDGLSSTIEIDEATYIDGKRSLRVNPIGTTNWFFIVAYSPIPLEVGTQYTTSFWAKAEEPRPLGAKMKPTDNSTDGWGWTDFELTTEWAEYAITSEALNAEAKFEFHCAGSEVTLWLDFVSVYEGEYIPGIEPVGALKATEPYPADGAIDVSGEITLSWTSGKSADKHEVYFGTDINDVNNADITDTTGIYRGSQDLDATSYTPTEVPLQWDQTYYWRIDEVNEAEPTSLWKGNVWSFTTTNYVVVDDFEDYDVGNNEIWWSWKDGLGYAAHDNEPAYPGNGTGSAVGDENSPSYMEETIVHSGSKSMPVSYDNSTAGLSEVNRTLNADWTQDDVLTLTLFYKGNLSNDAEPMYIALNGTVITHDNPQAARASGWTQWDILLQDFADLGVDLTNINTMSIGFGNKANPVSGGSGYVLIDDIRLYRSLPVELEPMPEPVDPGNANLVASYSFENNVQDGSDNGLDGTIRGNPAFVEGIAGMALSFDGVNDYVDLGNNAAFDITEQITLSAWVNTNDTGNGQHNPYVGKGDQTYAIKHASSNTIEFFIFDAGWYTANVRVDNSFNGEWHHVLGTYDGSELKTYVDGVLGATVAHQGTIEVQTHNLTIAMNSQETDRFYDGVIDEVKIYNRALSRDGIVEPTN